MRRFLALLVFFIPTLLCAEVKIAPADRVANQDPGYCSWAALETLGRHQKIQNLVGLVEGRKKDPDVTVMEHGRPVTYNAHSGYDWTIRAKLDKLGVKYRSTNNHDRSLFKYATDNDLPFTVSFQTGAFGGTAHAVVVVSYNDKEVEYIDPNKPGSTYVASRQWFDMWWDGWVLVLEPIADKTLAKDDKSVKPGVQDTRETGRVRPVIVDLNLKPINPVVPLTPPVKPVITQWRLQDDK